MMIYAVVSASHTNICLRRWFIGFVALKYFVIYCSFAERSAALVSWVLHSASWQLQ